MALIRVDGTGVGNYDANYGKIEAEDYFKASGTTKKMNTEGGFSMVEIDGGDFLVFPKVKGLEQKTKIELNLTNVKKSTIEIRDGSPKGKLIASYKLKNVKTNENYSFDFPLQQTARDLCFVFKGRKAGLLEFNSFIFK
jgi:hypothetical protein